MFSFALTLPFSNDLFLFGLLWSFIFFSIFWKKKETPKKELSAEKEKTDLPNSSMSIDAEIAAAIATAIAKHMHNYYTDQKLEITFSKNWRSFSAWNMSNRFFSNMKFPDIRKRR